MCSREEAQVRMRSSHMALDGHGLTKVSRGCGARARVVLAMVRLLDWRRGLSLDPQPLGPTPWLRQCVQLLPCGALSARRGPGVSGIAIKETEVVRQAIALQPGQGCFEFRERHLRSSLVGENPFQDCVVAVVEPLLGMG